MRRVLIVVDMQNDFVAEAGALNSAAAREILPFVGERIKEALAQGDEVELVGVCTNICCYFTAEELANRDVPTKVYVQGVASFDQKAHLFALGQMETVLGIQVV